MNNYKKDKWLEAIDVHVALKTTVAYRNAAGKTLEKQFTATFGYLAYFIAKEYADWNTGEGVFIAKSTFAATVGMSRTSVVVPFFQIMEALDLLVKDDSKKKYDSDYYDLRMPRLFPDETDIKTRVDAAKKAAAAKKADYRARLSSEETVSVLSEDSVCPPVGQCLSSQRTLTTNRTSNVSSNLTTNKAVADAPSLSSREYKEQGEVVENVVSSSSESSLESIDNPSLDVVDSSASSLALNEKSSAAPAAWDTDLSWETDKESRPAAEKEMTEDLFVEWFEKASDEEKDIAAYGYEHRKRDALAKIVLVAEEVVRGDYEEWPNPTLKYTYAEKNVSYDGPGRKTAEPVKKNDDFMEMDW